MNSQLLSKAYDAKDQYKLHKKQMWIHLKTYLKYFFKDIFKHRKLFYSLQLLSVVSGLGMLWMIVINPFHFRNQKLITNVSTDTVYVEDSTKTMEAFLNKLGEVESQNNYKALNQFGYMGKYQIGFTALKQIGLGSLSKEQFLNNPELQEAAIKMLLRENKRILSNYIGKYQSQTIKGIYVTESGILAAAQMAPGGTMKFLATKGDSIFRDGNGVPITKYLKQFSGYKIIL